MASSFSVIFEDFEQELGEIRTLLEIMRDPKAARPRARVAAANATVLLLAATFEEYVRELARAYARAVVAATPSYDKLPSKMATVAWKRTMESLAKIQLNPKTETFSRESVFSDAQTKFSIVFDFCRGDLNQDIYDDLIHNDNNMRPNELNSLFKISGLSNVCMISAEDAELKSFLGEDDQGRAHAKLVDALEDFFERRNLVAHSIRAMQSEGPVSISKDVDFLLQFGKSLALTLEAKAPNSAVA